MDPAELRDFCLSLPRAEETFPFGPKTFSGVPERPST
jgi:hypothetical protein